MQTLESLRLRLDHRGLQRQWVDLADALRQADATASAPLVFVPHSGFVKSLSFFDM